MARTMKDFIKPALKNPKLPNKTKKITKTVPAKVLSPKKTNDTLRALTSKILQTFQSKVTPTQSLATQSNSKKPHQVAASKQQGIAGQAKINGTSILSSPVPSKKSTPTKKKIAKKLLRSGKQFGTYASMKNNTAPQVQKKTKIPAKKEIVTSNQKGQKRQLPRTIVLDSPSQPDEEQLNNHETELSGSTIKQKPVNKNLTIHDDDEFQPKQDTHRIIQGKEQIKKRSSEEAGNVNHHEFSFAKPDRKKRCSIQVQSSTDRRQDKSEPVQELSHLMELDIVFCCDTTSGMGQYLAATIDQIAAIYKKTKPLQDVIDVKYGFVCYRDHPPEEDSYVVKVSDLTTPLKTAQFIEKQTAEGGGDTPEAVMDGLFAATTKISWRKNSKKYVFHIADAPPHGDIYTGAAGGFLNRSFVWRDGCPCGLSIEKLAPLMNNLNIHYRLIKAGRNMDKMGQIFKSCIDHYAEVQVDSPEGLDFIFADLIAKQCLVAANRIIEQQKEQENYAKMMKQDQFYSFSKQSRQHEYEDNYQSEEDNNQRKYEQYKIGNNQQQNNPIFQGSTARKQYQNYYLY